MPANTGWRWNGHVIIHGCVYWILQQLNIVYMDCTLDKKFIGENKIQMKHQSQEKVY